MRSLGVCKQTIKSLADTTDTLPDLALREGFLNSPTKGGYRVGVDARQVSAFVCIAPVDD